MKLKTSVLNHNQSKLDSDFDANNGNVIIEVLLE